MSGPLSDVRITDITTVVMGPYATQILGAEGLSLFSSRQTSSRWWRLKRTVVFERRNHAPYLRHARRIDAGIDNLRQERAVDDTLVVSAQRQ